MTEKPEEQPKVDTEGVVQTHDHEPKPQFKGSISREEQSADEQPDEQQGSKVDQSFSHRSNRSAERGGQNQQQGEPTPGYGTEAPQVQGGGKR